MAACACAYMALLPDVLQALAAPIVSLRVTELSCQKEHWLARSHLVAAQQALLALPWDWAMVLQLLLELGREQLR